MAKGFFVPESFSANYVDNLRNEEGTYKYENQLRDVGIQKQAAIQDLNKTYSDTINNAYSSYLNSKRSIMSSNIGEGYKQAYLQGQEAQLQQNIAQASVNAASARQQIETQEAKASDEIGEAFKTEVSNMNRVAESMQQYLVYLKGLTKGEGDQAQKYITEDQEKYRLDQMYDVIFNAQPYDYKDKTGVAGASYIEWANAQVKNTQADRDWFNWLTTYGGLQQFKQAAQPLIDAEKAARQAENKEYDDAVKAAKERYHSIVGLGKVNNTKLGKDMSVEINGKTHKIEPIRQDNALIKAMLINQGYIDEQGNGRLRKGDIISINNKQYVYIPSTRGYHKDDMNFWLVK